MRKTWLFILLVTVIVVSSCYKKTIEFGAEPENNFTRLVYIDTVDVKLSTVILDSFATNGATSLLLGKYTDPYLGVITAKPFFQLGLPAASVEIPATAVFDSLVFIIRKNTYYYGDTSRLQTIYVNELDQAISYSYNDKIYNSSSVAEKAIPLGSRTVRISPENTDSIVIRLDDIKGQELFTKLRQQSIDVTNVNEFLNYFKGISLSVGAADSSAIYRLSVASTMAMRLVYHHTTPSREDKYLDFPLQANDYVFNQLTSDRTGTLLPATSPGLKELFSSQTGNVSFSQTGMGLYLKMTFPSLRNLLQSGDIVKLLRADLVIRPAPLSFDRYKFKLPSSFYLAETNGSNNVGNSVVDSTGDGVLYASPYIDDIYGENSYYKFNVTAYINQLLNTTGSADYGFYLFESWSTGSMQVNRVIISDDVHSDYKTKLLLTVLVVNN